MDRRLFQNAWFVADLQAGIAKWETMFGAGPFTVAAHHKTDRFSYRGTEIEADVSYAFGYLGDLMIQLIEQHDEKASIYRDMFAGGEEGFHHIAYLVDDFEAEYARLESLGYACATRLYADGVDAAYFDARRDLGCFIEIHGSPPHILETFAEWKAAHDRRAAGQG